MSNLIAISGDYKLHYYERMTLQFCNCILTLHGIHRLGTRLDFGTEQIAIFIGELYFMLPVTFQVKHLILFPRMENARNISNKMN